MASTEFDCLPHEALDDAAEAELTRTALEVGDYYTEAERTEWNRRRVEYEAARYPDAGNWD